MAEVLRWDMYPAPTELRSWAIPIPFAVISAKLTILEPCRRGRWRKASKEENMSEWLQNRDLRGIWLLWRSIGLQQCQVRAHLSARGISEQTCSTLDSLSTEKLVAIDSNENSVSSSQVWHTDSVPNSSTVKLVARSNKGTVGQRLIPRNLTTSPHSVGFKDKVFANVRQKLGRPKDGKMDQIEKSTLWSGNIYGCVHGGSCTSRKRFWRKFTRYEEHRYLRDSAFVLHPAEIDWSLINSLKYLEWARSTGVKLMDGKNFGTWTCHQVNDSKGFVFSDSVLCLGGRIAEYPLSVKSWTAKTN